MASSTPKDPMPGTGKDASSAEDRPGAGVGAILRGARLVRGEDIQTVSYALRIRKPYLEAIEEGRVEDLPGLTYGIGFVRAYAEYLGLDAEETVSRFKEESSRIDVKTHLQFPEPLPGNRVPTGTLLIFALLFAGAVYGGYLYSASKDVTFVEAVEAVPGDLLDLIDGDAPEETETAPLPSPPPEQEPEQEEASPSSTAPAAADPAVEEETTEAVEQSATDVPETAASAIDAIEEAVEETGEQIAAALPEAEPPQTEASPVSEEAAATPAPDAGIEQESTTAPDPVVTEEAETIPAPEAPLENVPESVETEEPNPVAEAPAEDTLPLPDPPEPPSAETDGVEVAEQDATAPDASAEADAVPETEATASPDEIQSEDLPEPSAEASIETTDLPPPDLTDDAPEAASEEEDTVAEPAPQEEEAADLASAATGVRIILQATDEVWVRVVDADGTALIEKLMLMGEIYRVPDQAGLVMETGNAGALRLLVNGTMAPALGEVGEVRRDISLTEEALLGDDG